MATVGLVRKDNGALSITIDCEPGEVEGILETSGESSPLSGDVAQRLLSEAQDLVSSLTQLVAGAELAPAEPDQPAS